MNSKTERFKVTHPTRERKAVSFAFSWYENRYYTLSVAPGESSTDRWLINHSPIWEVGSVGVSLIIDDSLRSDPRFFDFRWYTAEEWNKSGDIWQERPY